MANSFSGYVLTDKGRELQAAAEAGTTLNLTKMQLGTGTVESLGDYASKTALVSPVLSTLITSKTQSGTICTITATVSSDGVDSGFNATELGLYAQDGDTEYLYAVSYNADRPTYVAGKGDNVSLSTTFKMQLSFASEPTINVVLPADQEKIVTMVQNSAIKSIDAAKAAAESEASAAASAKSANTDAGSAASSAVIAADRATAAENSQTAAASSASAAASSAAAALESSTGATTAMNETKKQAQQAAASIAEASALVDKTEKNSTIVSEQLKQAQALATASAGIQIYLDDDGDLAYRMIE